MPTCNVCATSWLTRSDCWSRPRQLLAPHRCKQYQQQGWLHHVWSHIDCVVELQASTSPVVLTTKPAQVLFATFLFGNKTKQKQKQKQKQKTKTKNVTENVFMLLFWSAKSRIAKAADWAEDVNDDWPCADHRPPPFQPQGLCCMHPHFESLIHSPPILTHSHAIRELIKDSG